MTPKQISHMGFHMPYDVMHTLMERVETEEAKDALRIADEVSDMILFHSRVRENGIKMMQPAEV